MKQNSSVRDVENILNQLNIYYEREKTFNDLKYKGKLRFDYYLPKYNLCIEFNGAQHYEYIEYFHKDDSQFDEQRIKDYIKHEYCRAHSIHLIELPCSLTNDEIRAELVHFINEHGDETHHLLPEIESFLKLNKSYEVYINQLYKTYQKMLKQLSINNRSDYKIFYDYVIDYWDLKDKQIVMVNNNFYERWINENVDKNIKFSNNDKYNLVVQHLNELEEMGVLNYNMIVFNVIYAHYKDWLNFSNPGSKPLKQIEYTKRMKKLLRDYGYNEDAKRTIRNINKQDFDLNLFDNIYYDESKKSNVVMRPKVNVENQLDEFYFNLKNKSIENIKMKYSDQFIKEYINYMFQKEQSELMIIFSDYIVDDVHTLDIDTIIEKLIDYYQE